MVVTLPQLRNLCSSRARCSIAPAAEYIAIESAMATGLAPHNRKRLHSALHCLTPEEFEHRGHARGSDGTDGSDGKPKAALPSLPQAVEIPLGFSHSRGTPFDFSLTIYTPGRKCHQIFGPKRVSLKGCGPC
jgi:hypothetical protein